MKLNLGTKIRDMRRKSGFTQETLSSALGVTPQAVSRWESGGSYPDMELIPSLANCFGITIDELFGYENDREARIEALAVRIEEMNAQNNGLDVSMEECISLARNALIEFPGNARLMLCLASALFNAGYVRRGEHHIHDADGCSIYDAALHRTYPEWQEAIALYEKLLVILPDGEMRRRTVREVMQLYLNTGEREKALTLAESAPDVQDCREFLRLRACDGKAQLQAHRNALLHTLRAAAELPLGIVLCAGGNLSPAQKAQHLEHAIGLFDHACTADLPEEHHAFIAKLHMLRSHCLWLDGKKDEAFAALEASRAHYPLPAEDFPWWNVPEAERVKAEMRLDARWTASV